MKYLIFDSGPLINLSMNGLLDMLERLKNGFDGKFIITPQVKYEVIDRPLGVKMFELGALRVQALLDKKVLEMPSDIGISENDVQREMKLLLDKANHTVQVREQWVNIVSEAEMSCLAIGKMLSSKDNEVIIAIDERTTRVLCEKPLALEELMSNRLHQRVKLIFSDLSAFKGFRFIRSPELIYVAYKKGVLELEGKKALEAALYATKFKGSAISFEEIEDIKKLG